jgi:hypothetical protein
VPWRLPTKTVFKGAPTTNERAFGTSANIEILKPGGSFILFRIFEKSAAIPVVGEKNKPLAMITIPIN